MADRGEVDAATRWAGVRHALAVPAVVASQLARAQVQHQVRAATLARGMPGARPAIQHGSEAPAVDEDEGLLARLDAPGDGGHQRRSKTLTGPVGASVHGAHVRQLRAGRARGERHELVAAIARIGEALERRSRRSQHDGDAKSLRPPHRHISRQQRHLLLLVRRVMFSSTTMRPRFRNGISTAVACRARCPPGRIARRASAGPFALAQVTVVRGPAGGERPLIGLELRRRPISGTRWGLCPAGIAAAMAKSTPRLAAPGDAVQQDGVKAAHGRVDALDRRCCSGVSAGSADATRVWGAANGRGMGGSPARRRGGRAVASPRPRPLARRAQISELEPAAASGGTSSTRR